MQKFLYEDLRNLISKFLYLNFNFEKKLLGFENIIILDSSFEYC